MKIDTKELRELEAFSDEKHEFLEKVADELDRLYAQEAKDAETIAKLCKAIEHIKTHCEFSVPKGFEFMATWQIANKALEGGT